MNRLTFSPALSGLFIQTGSELLEALQQRQQKPLLATHVPELDRLQGGGIRRGTFVGVSGERSSGRLAIGLAALAAATQGGESAAFIDVGNQLDPQGAQAAGMNLKRLLWVRPPSPQMALLSTEMILATGFGLVVLDLGLNPVSSRHFPEAAWLRLARGTIEHKSILLVITLHPLQSVAADVLVQTKPVKTGWTGDKTTRLLSGISVQVNVRKRKGFHEEQDGTIVFRTPMSMGK